MEITKEQAIDILDKFDFFQGQRAGRELWNDKPFEVQEQDIKDFSNGVALLKEYIADVVPKSEVERLKRENEILSQNADTAFQDGLNEAQDLYKEQIKTEVAREIFEEIEKLIFPYMIPVMPNNTMAINLGEFSELKKKYTEENTENENQN